jgi:8-oxo-dGTP pyrophosphatase MutT (NUDIX family)
MAGQTGYLRHVAFCTTHAAHHFVPFEIGGVAYGEIRREIAEALLNATDDVERLPSGALALAARHATYDQRTAALARTTETLCAHFNASLRHENYPVINAWGDAPVAELDRIAVPWFGVRGFGVHVNGYVQKPDGLYLWIAERAADRLLDPGKLDHIVAGGSPIGLGIRENLAKEAHEEANIPPALVAQAEPVKALAYHVDRLGGVRYDTLFVYDLPLPQDFKPENTDGEVAAFTLLPATEVARLVAETDRFKFNCNLVILDFLLRHNVIAPDHPERPALRTALAPLEEPMPTEGA